MTEPRTAQNGHPRPREEVSRHLTQVSTQSPGLRHATALGVATALAHLCALKRTSNFTDLQVDAWYGGLSAFPDWIINRAVLELATSETRFPEFGDVYQLCRRHALKTGIMKQPEVSQYTDGKTERKVTNDEIHTIGSALGLMTRNPNERKASE